ncbi:hypothetical protein DL98DRAFT_91829 [Cadophora sp. DSE1049]|nr:hypothetical protein DL98DRAFT_91829 [Cadophora sp. DSE1049]
MHFSLMNVVALAASAQAVRINPLSVKYLDLYHYLLCSARCPRTVAEIIGMDAETSVLTISLSVIEMSIQKTTVRIV